MSAPTTSSAFFEDMYRRSGDPWNFSGDAYELGRYTSIVNALRGRRYERAFEPGCSVGVLTEQLASMCGHVDASDFAETAAREARDRCACLSNVSVHCAALRPEQDFAPYDLVVLSEIGYYFTTGDWHALVKRLNRTAHPHATVIACHWLGNSADHVTSGDSVHEELLRELQMPCFHRERHESPGGGFRLEAWRRG